MKTFVSIIALSFMLATTLATTTNTAHAQKDERSQMAKILEKMTKKYGLGDSESKQTDEVYIINPDNTVTRAKVKRKRNDNKYKRQDKPAKCIGWSFGVGKRCKDSKAKSGGNKYD